MITIDQQTRVTGLFGYPLKHTLSPGMQNAAFESLGLNFVYLAFEIPPAELKKAVEALRTLNIRGVNVTIPYKEAVIPYLDKVDKRAAGIGSVNTIINDGGVLTGYNTDAPGFLDDLRSKGFDPRNKTALLAGAGGAGRAIAKALSTAGIKRLFIVDTDAVRGKNLADRVSRAKTLGAGGWKQKIKDVDLLVNATPIGMNPGNKALAEKSFLRRGLFVYDVVYNRKTELLAAAKKAGAKNSDGLGMLLRQGALSFELFTGKIAPLEVMKKALIKKVR
jgi:shikimate dehydrogenase